VEPRLWVAFRILRFLLCAAAVNYLAWVMDSRNEPMQSPRWLGMARVGLGLLTLWACALPRMFEWQPFVDRLRARGKDPRKVVHKMAVAMAAAPLLAALIMVSEGASATDAYVVTVICFGSIIFWTRRYVRGTGPDSAGSNAQHAG
jgi:hypothetical protein